jgi:hypothetical protein
MQRTTAMANTQKQAPAVECQRQCARCVPGSFRRINRSTLLERTFFTWLGFYPWECVTCRRKRFFRDQGRTKAGSAATA